MTRSIFTVAMALTAATSINAFSPSTRVVTRTQPLNMAAIDVGSEKEFDAKISGAGDKLVVIDYSTTWCGPCKVIAPKFDELSDKYSDSIFIKVRLVLQTYCNCCTMSKMGDIFKSERQSQICR